MIIRLLLLLILLISLFNSIYARSTGNINSSNMQPSSSFSNPTDVSQRHMNGQGPLTEGTSERLRERLATYRQVNSNPGGDMARRLTRFNGRYSV